MTTIPDIDTLGAAKYVSLTTFRFDGSAVATPVWVVRDGDALRILTDPESGKVRRLRANPALRLSPCDARGRVASVAVAAEGVAVLEDDDGTARVRHIGLRATLT